MTEEDGEKEETKKTRVHRDPYAKVDE